MKELSDKELERVSGGGGFNYPAEPEAGKWYIDGSGGDYYLYHCISLDTLSGASLPGHHGSWDMYEKVSDGVNTFFMNVTFGPHRPYDAYPPQEIV